MVSIDKFQEGGQELAETIGDKVESLATNAWEIGTNLVSKAVTAGSEIIEDIPEMTEKIQQKVSDVKETLDPVSDRVEEVATHAWEIGKDLAGKAVTVSSELVEDLPGIAGKVKEQLIGKKAPTPESSTEGNQSDGEDSRGVHTAPLEEIPDPEKDPNKSLPTSSGGSYYPDDDNIQQPNGDTEYGNFDALKNELGLGHMPTVSQNSYTISDDTNNDGQIDYVYDRDNRSIPYHIAEDTNGDGKVDLIYNRYDTDGDGYYETVVEAFDENKDGKFDYASKSYDTNGDGHHDTVKYAYSNQSNSANGNIPSPNQYQGGSGIASSPATNPPGTTTNYGNFDSLKNELGLGNMPTVSQNSYTIAEDTNGDRKIDSVYDDDNRSIPYHIAEDTNGDGKIDNVYNRYDTDGDGYYETVVEAFDENNDGTFDYAYKSYDTNGDGHHDTVRYVYSNQSDSYTDQTMLSNGIDNVSDEPDSYIGNTEENYDFDAQMT